MNPKKDFLLECATNMGLLLLRIIMAKIHLAIQALRIENCFSIDYKQLTVEQRP
jgi:hypothetical protein